MEWLRKQAEGLRDKIKAGDMPRIPGDTIKRHMGGGFGGAMREAQGMGDAFAGAYTDPAQDIGNMYKRHAAGGFEGAMNEAKNFTAADDIGAMYKRHAEGGMPGAFREGAGMRDAAVGNYMTGGDDLERARLRGTRAAGRSAQEGGPMAQQINHYARMLMGG